MSTRVHIYKWLRQAALMVAVLAGALPAAAQVAGEIDGGDAFYIYQNDGHFDGFFYDQVKQISYSRLDTLGVEYKDYVSQEIVTEDSVYRIMLTAIDSVSFYQPEIKYAKGLRFMREEGMMDYFKEYIYDPDLLHVVGFDPSMPEALQPKVGDVLYCDSVTGYPDGAFVFKVTRVIPRESFLIVCCDYITDYRDVYEQFITVEQVRNTQTPEGSRTMRRVAGWKQQPKKIEGNVEEATIFNLNTGFSAKHKFYGTLGVELALNVNFGVALSATYNISLSNWYFKIDTKAQFGIGASFGLDGELSKDIDFASLPSTTMDLSAFKRIPIPGNVPIFYIVAAPEPSAHVEAHLNVKLNTGFKAFAISQRIESMKTIPYVRIQNAIITPFLPIPVDWGTQKDWSINAQLNGSLQVGVKFPITLGSQPWISKILGLTTGLEILCGPKVTGVLDLSFLKNGSDGFFSAALPKGTYERLKGSKVDVSLFSVDPQFKARVETFGVDWDFKRTTNLSFGNFTLHLFPEIKGLSCEVLGENLNKVNAKVSKIEGDVCMPERVGFALYKQKDEDDKEYSELYRYMTRDETYFLNTFNEFDLTMEDVAPGNYKVFPVVSTAFGVVAVESESQHVTIAPQELLLNPDTLTVEEEGGKYEIELLTSIAQDLTCSPDDDWVDAEIKYNVGPTKSTIMYVTVHENETGRPRRGGVTVNQVLKDGGMVEKHLGIMQFGGLWLEPDSLSFESDGGEKEVLVLSSYKPITINLNDGSDWLHEVYFDDEHRLYITANKNEGIDRRATVIVAGWSPKYQGISQVSLPVHQKGVIDVTVDKNELEFPANGGGDIVNITMGGNYSFDDVEVSEEDKEWLTVEKKPETVIVNAMPNTTAEERVTTISLVFKKKNTTAPGPIVYEIPIKITQKAAIASIDRDQLHFKAEGGSEKVKIEFGIYPYCGAFVSEDGADWCDINVAGDGTVTVKVGENPSVIDRECVVVCYVSGKPDASVEEMQKMNVLVTQDGKKIEPDGDNSPIKSIVFTAQRQCRAVIDGEPTDSIFTSYASFNFKPDNSQFRYYIDKATGTVHYDLQGYVESLYDTRGDRQTAHLSFDVTKADKVQNLTFLLSRVDYFDMTVPGVATSHTTMNSTWDVAVGQFPLDLNTTKLMLSKQPLTVADGLNFITYSLKSTNSTWYTPSALYPEPIPSVRSSSSLIPLEDSSDGVYLYISLKEALVPIEWPSNEIMNSLSKDGMPVNTGNTPPNVTGTYMMSPLHVVANKLDEPVEMGGVTGMVVKFSALENGQVNIDYYSVYGGQVDEAMGSIQAMIQGSGNKFTICAPDLDGYTIFSGTIENGEVTDLHMAASSGKAGKHFIMNDDDGSSSKTDWLPAPPEDD